jgi:hypothetical protein
MQGRFGLSQAKPKPWTMRRNMRHQSTDGKCNPGSAALSQQKSVTERRGGGDVVQIGLVNANGSSAMDARTSRYHEVYACWQRDPQAF